jgi:hypothetical protein
MTPADGASIDIVQVISLSVAPVFLLSGVGITLTVLTNRLARIVDRARRLEEAEKAASAPKPGDAPAKPLDAAELRDRQEQIRVLGRRARLINVAITLSTVCALLVSLVVVTLFVSEFMSLDLSALIAAMFVIAMLSFISALLFFLREVFLSIAVLRIGARH